MALKNNKQGKPIYNILDHSHSVAKETVVINWLLGTTCNFKCNYCPDFLHSGTGDWPRKKQIITFIDAIANHVAPKKIYFEFTGGEVTLFKELLDIATYVRDSGHTVGIISNGSMSLSWWKRNKEYLDHVCFSYHTEFGNPEKFLKVIKEVNDSMRTHVNIMMDPQNWDNCITLAERIPQECKNISLALQPLMEELGAFETVYKYTEEQQEVLDRQHHLYGSKIKWDVNHSVPRGAMNMIDTKNQLSEISSAHRLISNNLNDWSEWWCWAGMENFVVDHDGSLWRGWCREGGSLGNFYREITLPEEPWLCKKGFCHCNYDIMCKKEKGNAWKTRTQTVEAC